MMRPHVKQTNEKELAGDMFAGLIIFICFLAVLSTVI